MIKIKNKALLLSILLLALVCLFLYFRPLSEGKPLGLDALGHLSKVSYIKEFPHASWDLAWYNGAPFLKFYSPAFYYFAALFPNPIFGANFIGVLSIFLTSLGILLLVYHYTGKVFPSLVSGVLFLTVLNTSYYFISVGNHPFVLAFWTIPFILLFLEKSLQNKLFFLPFCLTFVFSILAHIFITLCIIPVLALRLLYFEGLTKKFVRHLLIFIFLPLLLSSFWLLPFLTHSSSYVGDDLGYLPTLNHLLGFGDYRTWGYAAGEIGLVMFFFLISVVIFLSTGYFKHKNESLFLITSVSFLVLMWGILGKYNPRGIGAVRYIVPFSIFAGIFSGLILSRLKIRRKFILGLCLSVLILFGLFINYKTITQNYNHYSYSGAGSRYDFIQKVLKNETFPLKNEFTNYRFGTTRFAFSETLNFFYPRVSQTFGYYEQGMMNPQALSLMRKKVYNSHDLNSTLFFLDAFGIKYLEIGGQDFAFRQKFDNSGEFREVMQLTVADYPFVLYEYLNASPIISLFSTSVQSVEFSASDDLERFVSNNNNFHSTISLISEDLINVSRNYSMKNFSVLRNSPDWVELKSENIQGGDLVLFKESYHSSWKAKEQPSGDRLRIYQTSLGFMAVLPSDGAREIIFYQQKTPLEIIGILLSLICIIFILVYLRKSNS